MTNTLPGFQEATGTIDYTLTNDYMFRAILQTNELVLKGLISSLLHLPFGEIASVNIENPIELGAAVNNKDFVLDTRIFLNNHTILNLELQVSNHGNWPDRSLSYLCRNFDRLNKGEDYADTLPAIHIGILDFTLFPDDPEFYATNKRYNSHARQSTRFFMFYACELQRATPIFKVACGEMGVALAVFMCSLHAPQRSAWRGCEK